MPQPALRLPSLLLALGSTLALTACEPRHAAPVVPERSLEAFANCQDMVAHARGQLEAELERDYARTRKKHLQSRTTHSRLAPKLFRSAGQFLEAQNRVEAKSNGQSARVLADGQRMYILDEEVLKIVDLTPSAPRLIDQLPLRPGQGLFGGRLLLSGQKLLIIGGNSPPSGAEDDPWTFPVVLIDISGKARVVQRWEFDGRLTDVHQHGSVIRLALQNTPYALKLHEPWFYVHGFGCRHGDASNRYGLPCVDSWEAGIGRAQLHNRAALDALDENALIPQFRSILPGSDQAPQVQALHSCDAVMRQGLAAGVDMLSVLTFDLSQPQALGERLGIMATETRTLMTPESLYVATETWDTWIPRMPFGVARTYAASDAGEDQPRTFLHKLTGHMHLDYQGTGVTEGILMQRGAMSEHEGVLRVAMTAPTTSPNAYYDHFLASFVHKGKSLEPLARIEPLQDTGYLHIVHMLGDLGFSDAVEDTKSIQPIRFNAPQGATIGATIELEGASAYLHPLAPGYLLSIERIDPSSSNGHRQQMVAKIYDIRDLHAPKLVHRHPLAQDVELTELEHDSTRFVYSPESERLVISLRGYAAGEHEGQGRVQRLELLSVNLDTGFRLIRNLEHRVEATEIPIDEVMLVDQTLWTLSRLGLKGSSLQSGDDVAWLQLREPKTRQAATAL